MNTPFVAPMVAPLEPTDTAEYVLGLLDAGMDRAVEARIRQQRAARREATAWSLAVADSLLQQTAERQPPGWLWSRIERQVPAMTVPTLSKVEQRWRLVAAFVAIIGLAALVAVVVPTQAPMRPGHSAMLALAKNDTPTWEVMANFRDRQLEIKALRDCAVIPGRKPVLWLATPEGQTIAVGSLPMDAGEKMMVQPVLWHGNMGGTALAISLEPMNAPIGSKPQGPVVWSGGWQAMRS